MLKKLLMNNVFLMKSKVHHGLQDMNPMTSMEQG